MRTTINPSLRAENMQSPTTMSHFKEEPMTATTPLALARTHSLWKLDAELQDLTERAQEEEAGPCPGCDGKQLIPTPTGPVTCPECAGKGTGVISAATQEALTAYFEATVQKVDRVAEFLKFLKALRSEERRVGEECVCRWTGLGEV